MLAATVYEDDGNSLLVADVSVEDATPSVSTRQLRPGDDHVIGRRAVWERTLAKIERAFDEHLQGE